MRTSRGAGLKFWRYSLPRTDITSGWAIVLMDSTGMFAVVSDWGNWAYQWTHHGADDFRKFVVKLSGSYVQRKLDPETVYDGEATLENVRWDILESRRCGYRSKEWARREWDKLEAYDLLSEHGWSEWLQQCDWSDAYELCSTGPKPGIDQFCKQVLPRLQDMIYEDLKEETERIK